MKLESAKKATELLAEIEKLSEYKKLLNNNEHGRVAHIAFVQHYGNVDDYGKIDFDHKYNKLFLPVIEGIIKKLEEELELL